jgi:GT2 family glycosyltransferase
MNGKIGLGIVTCNRENLFKKCVENLPDVDYLIIVNDGRPYSGESYPVKNNIKILQHRINLGVGKSKNEILKYLMEKDCEHLFIMEDDIQIINTNICNLYIKASQKSGIRHFNFLYHGPLNKNHDGTPNPRKIINYDDNIKISLNTNVGASLSYFHRSVIEKCGYIDEIYYNMWEHVDHTYQIIKGGFHPPQYWFADLADSQKYVKDLDPDLTKSSIRKNILSYKIKYYFYKALFIWKNGFEVERRYKESVVLDILKQIKEKYGVKQN